VSPKALRWYVAAGFLLGAYWTVKSLVRIAADHYPYDGLLVLDLAVGLGYLTFVVATLLHYRRTGWGEQDEDQLVPDGDQHQD